MKKLVLCMQVIGCIALFQSAVLIDAMMMKAEVQPSVRNGLLVFLDDEGRENRFNPVCHDFLSAFIQRAGPIIVSASLIVDVCDYKPLGKKNPQKLLKQFENIKESYGEGAIDESLEKESNMIFSVVAFTTEVAQHWIIKKINSSLYLLLPDSYLQEKKIDKNTLTLFTPRASLTPLELALGLKVNHMQTVSVTDVKRPSIKWTYADYFMESLWKTGENSSSIFVVNAEYAERYIKPPVWVLYMSGHGDIRHSVVHLSLEQVRYLLTFLEKKINLELLFYNSCYGAGINSNLLYKDAKAAIDITYPFVIITKTLTDALTHIRPMSLCIQTGALKAKSGLAYYDFLQQVTKSDVIDYHKISELLLPDLEAVGAGSLPQIKFPGVPWFSVLDNHKVVSIGSILSKSRTAPLSLSTFFAKKGKKAQPLALLLYTSNVPFELIIDTKTASGNAPAIISMIPGDALHIIKKIFSTVCTADEIIYSFLTLDRLVPFKLFVINQLTALSSEMMQKICKQSGIDVSDPFITLHNVIITLSFNVATSSEDYVIYFTHKGVFYLMDKMQDRTIEKDYLLMYADILKSFAGKPFISKPEEKVEKRSVSQLLTPESITHIKETLEKKIPKKEDEK